MLKFYFLLFPHTVLEQSAQVSLGRKCSSTNSGSVLVIILAKLQTLPTFHSQDLPEILFVLSRPLESTDKLYRHLYLNIYPRNI